MGEFITDRDFAKWTANWMELEDQQEPFNFFKLGKDTYLLGSFLEPEDIETLFSAIGVSEIKVRLGVDEDNKFKLILFGTDNTGERFTPYYAHTPIDSEQIKDGDSDGNVPDILADKWKEYWLEHVKKDIFSKHFMTHSGFLQGYNYTSKELIDSLFKFDIENPPRIYICFVLHKYIAFNADTNFNPYDFTHRYTFGLLFQAIPTPSSDKYDPATGELIILNDAPSSGYYDLSAPCPRTC